MIIELLALLLTVVGIAYGIFKYKTTYWSRHGVHSENNATFPLGNDPIFHPDVLGSKRNPAYVMEELYQKHKEKPFVGIYGPLGQQSMVINDLELIKHILIKDFEVFVDRFGQFNVFAGDSEVFTDRLWRQQLLVLKGELWKDVRSVFSPVFTSGKMKLMMHFMKSISLNLREEMRQCAEDSKPIDLKDLFGKYSMDTIATCGFGVDAGSFGSSQETTFVKHAKNVFGRNHWDGFMLMCSVIPGLNAFCKMLKLPFFKPVETKFFYDIIMQTIQNRVKTKERKNDLVDLMIEAIHFEKTLKEKGEIEVEDGGFIQSSTLVHKIKKTDFDETLVVSNALLILIAGYDTTAMTMTYCAYELAKSQIAQEKLIQEIDEVMASLPDDQDFPDYNTIQTMPYLDSVLHETLRLHCPIPFIIRNNSRDYKIPGHDVMIPKGSDVYVMAYSIMRDDRYFNQPNEFNPDNFSKESKEKRSPYAYLPFGQGPRACIGMRFALLEAKVGLVSVLTKYRIKTCEDTPLHAIRNNHTFLGNPRDKLWVAVEVR
ncbi:cytochrome P450 6k1-like [Tigriopus californicus]|uniref:cytochrome P450 6k1-like n=1 Tax=Tigriopus californicus TaxID=6832 RepID=UPI0027DA9CC4|nr:cytochrome P450 6k1-like [Tigriopus californicus]|eukprot:TCALIF_13166-PA protein Name:"Similar to CYP6K1 Cytochrome P450 6k1 (Blattella germanica)" AED:0.02 eAED:0.02 QI:0/-1/0/1/-1/1/1/0/540